MKSHIVILYATHTGTTAMIAERIRDRLSDHGVVAEVGPVSGPQPQVEGQDSLYILGAPINGMRLIPEFTTFVDNHEDLSGSVLAVFAVSYIYTPGRRIWKQAIRKSLDRVAEKLGVTSTTIFDGRVAAPFPAFARFLFGIPADLPGDTLNLDAADQWVDELLPVVRANLKT